MSTEDTVRLYFDSWTRKDPSVIRDRFAEDVLYVESHGPAYEGRDQCLAWFRDWNERGSVLQWNIRSIKSVGGTVFAEWYFECEYDGGVGGFDGISVIEFNGDGLVTSIREFRSETRHEYPYRK